MSKSLTRNEKSWHGKSSSQKKPTLEKALNTIMAATETTLALRLPVCTTISVEPSPGCNSKERGQSYQWATGICAERFGDLANSGDLVVRPGGSKFCMTNYAAALMFSELLSQHVCWDPAISPRQRRSSGCKLYSVNFPLSILVQRCR